MMRGKEIEGFLVLPTVTMCFDDSTTRLPFVIESKLLQPTTFGTPNYNNVSLSGHIINNYVLNANGNLPERYFLQAANKAHLAH